MVLREQAIARLLEAIQTLSVDDLAALEAVLRSPSARESLWRMLRELLSLRKEALALPLFDDNASPGNERPVSKDASRAASEQALQRLIRSEELSREAFYDIFLNRERFLSTRDVVKELNRSFRLNLSYEKFRKRGRRDVLQSAWTQIGERPERHRRTALRRFFSQILDASDDAEEYTLLFRILTNNGSNTAKVP